MFSIRATVVEDDACPQVVTHLKCSVARANATPKFPHVGIGLRLQCERPDLSQLMAAPAEGLNHPIDVDSDWVEPYIELKSE